MKRLGSWLRNKLRKWLGVSELKALHKDLVLLYATVHFKVTKLETLYKDLVLLGVDVHFKEPNTVVLITHLAGGRVSVTSMDDESMKDLMKQIDMLKRRYRTDRVVIDAPPDAREFIK